MAAPIELRLSPRKPRTVAGEGILLDLTVRTLAALELESPELNRFRTSLRIRPLSQGGDSRILTGEDYVRLHRVHPLAPIGELAQVQAGLEWQVTVELLNYTTALPVGRYSISLSYRFGSEARDAVETNSIDIDVTPADLVSAEYRWFGGPGPRQTLASIWVARDERGEHWFYQNANRRNPGAIKFATDLGYTAKRPGARPGLAHLNDIQGTHFERLAVWEQDGEIGVLRVHSGGCLGEPVYVRHRLAQGARVAQPPLQQTDDSLIVLLTGTDEGGRAAYSVVTVPKAGEANVRTSALPMSAERTFVLWPVEEGATPVLFLKDSAGRTLVSDTRNAGEPLIGEPVEAMVLSQWMGGGMAGGSIRDSESIWLFQMDAQNRTVAPAVMATHSIAKFPVRPGKLAGAAQHENGRVAVLYASDHGWLVLDKDQSFAIPARLRVSGAPALVPCAGGLFLVWYDPQGGFSADLVGQPTPGPAI